MNTLICLSGVLLATPDPLVAEVVAGHRANFGRVRTMRAVFNTRSGIEGDARVFERTALVYFRDPNGALVRDGVEGRMLAEHLFLGGETRSYTRVWPAKGRSPQVRAARSRSGQVPANFNLWLALGGELVGNELLPRGTDAVLSESDPPAQGSCDTRDGVSLIKVARAGKSPEGTPARIQEWYDPARGYVLVRSEWSGGDGSGTEEWFDFKRAADDVWLPMRQVIGAKVAAGRIFGETTVTEIAVNQPLPPGATSLTLPAGTVINDGLRDTEYKGNPDWSPAGPETPWRKLVIPAPPDPGTYAGPTQEEPVGWSRWLVYAAAALVVIGLAGLAVRKLLARRTGRAA